MTIMETGTSGYRSGVGATLSRSRLAIEFIATFSRFEFALKRGGCLKGGAGRPAAPDWDEFACRLGTSFFETIRAEPEAGILFNAPPKRLVVAVDETKPEFVTPEAVRSVQQLFEAVRRVRNNLFHGEKPGIDMRDRELVRASMFVLDCAMAACASTPGCEGVPAAFTVAHVDGA